MTSRTFNTGVDELSFVKTEQNCLFGSLALVLFSEWSTLQSLMVTTAILSCHLGFTYFQNGMLLFSKNMQERCYTVDTKLPSFANLSDIAKELEPSCSQYRALPNKSMPTSFIHWPIKKR